MDQAEKDARIDTERLRAEWRAMAPAWVRESREGDNVNRRGLLDPAMLAMCGDVTSLVALDCGCGEGRLCRILVERGAKRAIGVDTCEPMIEAARASAGPAEHYAVADAQALDFLEDASVDLAVSCLSQCDMPDSAANCRAVFRVLRPGGRYVVANLHPMRSAVGGWCSTNIGQKLYVPVDRYCDEGPRHWRMLGVDFTNFHRTLQTGVREFLDAGFRLADLVEPTPSDDAVARYPELADELRVPNFIVYAWEKPGG